MEKAGRHNLDQVIQVNVAYHGQIDMCVLIGTTEKGLPPPIEYFFHNLLKLTMKK